MHTDDWGWGIALGHGLFGILLWVLVIAVAIALVVQLTGIRSRGDRRRARDILQERYARGEIDREEYERKLKDLGG